MGLLLAMMNELHQSQTFVVIMGLVLLLFSLCSWTFGGIPYGNRYRSEFVTRQAHPAKFWFALVFLTLLGAIMFAGGIAGLLFT